MMYWENVKQLPRRCFYNQLISKALACNLLFFSLINIYELNAWQSLAYSPLSAAVSPPSK